LNSLSIVGSARLVKIRGGHRAGRASPLDSLETGRARGGAARLTRVSICYFESYFMLLDLFLLLDLF